MLRASQGMLAGRYAARERATARSVMLSEPARCSGGRHTVLPARSDITSCCVNAADSGEYARARAARVQVYVRAK